MKKMIEAMKTMVGLLRNGVEIDEVILAAEKSVPGIRRNIIEGILPDTVTLTVLWEIQCLSDEATDSILNSIGNDRLADLLETWTGGTDTPIIKERSI